MSAITIQSHTQIPSSAVRFKEKLLLLCLFVSTPAFGEETYACQKEESNDTQIYKLVVAADGVEFLSTEKERWQTLESWNEEFVHLTTDELRYAESLVECTPGATEEVACAASLLYVRTREGIPSEQEIRRKLLTRQPLEDVRSSPPPPIFPCSNCSAMHHVQKSARYCCKKKGQ